MKEPNDSTDTRGADSVHRLVMRSPMTPERHRHATELYLRAATPYMRALCELEMMMPLAFAQEPDGTLTKLEKHDWPEWAKAQASALEGCLDSIRRRAFESA